MGGSWQRLIGIGFLVAAAWAAHRSWEYRSEGVVVEGIVIRVDAKVAVEDGALSYSERPVVRFRRLDGGPPGTLEGHWATALFGGHAPGEKVRVRYLPDEADAAREDSALVDWGIPVVLLILGMAGLAGRLRSSGGETVLWRSGED